ncbi:beta-ketoacyl-[acyl-carrier-protein] synthase family protein [Streptomyces sp. NBC_01754]|uniref:beta-ketoacyl-[acyl-carrier-protein] synthase family protein n=1 Tax=Streptomyces sp. NBC_01754 TaxID=2975930 RepID=UPI002DDB64E8|nr:beta-ketoacyl-[acyl-carrier-protein] synthase family protein [Streptomyces sp. NBC_01754]WSC95302.1 beta-ketoacyl-[acyl-carrier-protein] synthase family protein [Streptomyces sp. NBC_01754]
MRTQAGRPVRPDVAISGMGVVTPAGCTTEELWTAVRAGRSLAAGLTHFDTGRHRIRIGCRVRGLTDGDGPAEPWRTVLAGKAAQRLDPFARYGLAAALAAHADAGLPEAPAARCAIVVGTAVGGRTTSDLESLNYADRGPQGVRPLMPLMTMPNAAAAQLALQLGWHGPALTVSTTCASGADAIGLGAAMLRDDRADIVIAGGCEATLTPVTLAGFGNLNAASTRTDAATACRPFDESRDGFVMGEGAAFVVLERAADARARGSRPHALVAGYAATSDAYHLSAPHPDGAFAADAMSGALGDAGLGPADIAHVNAHGTATVHNDRAEATALAKVFGPYGPPVTATKGVVGHLIGAAGAVELVVAVQAMNAGSVPPTANHTRTEPDMEIDVVHDAPRPVAVGPALTNSFGFGGHNSSLVVTPA